MKTYYTAWGRNNRFMISENPLGEDNPLVAFGIDIIEAENEQEAEQKAKLILKKRFKKIAEKKEYFNCLDCKKEFIKAFTPKVVAIKLCPQCYTKRAIGR